MSLCVMQDGKGRRSTDLQCRPMRTVLPMHLVDAYRMIRRRTTKAGFKQQASGTLENAQAMAAHKSPRMTKLYNRTATKSFWTRLSRFRFEASRVARTGVGYLWR